MSTFDVLRDSPEKRLPTIWREFQASAAHDSPDTKCLKCGRISWLAWRTNFCFKHNKLPYLYDWRDDGAVLSRSDEDFPDPSPIFE